MAETAATHASRRHRTICLPIPEPTYQRIIDDPHAFRSTVDDWFRRRPELFPRNSQGYQPSKLCRMSLLICRPPRSYNFAGGQPWWSTAISSNGLRKGIPSPS